MTNQRNSTRIFSPHGGDVRPVRRSFSEGGRTEGAYKYSLDPTPSCNKKRFVRYINTQTGEYLSPEFGRCDRETSCAYHLKPARRDFSPCQGGVAEGRGGPNLAPRTPDPVTYIPFDTFRQTLPNQKQNNFVQYLKTLFPRDTVKKLIIDFFIGASNHWPGATIFWQIDKQEKIHSGQVILFDKETGKRIKKPYPHVNWVHSLLIKKGKLKTFNLQQCLFGEHQLIFETNNKSVALVESAKTAIIMTGFYPDYIWMATNGSANINAIILQPLVNRNIILYPDLGQYDKWNEKATDLQKQGFKITTSNLLETNATLKDHQSGLDIADYFINHQLPSASAGGLTQLQNASIHYGHHQFNTLPHFQITKFSNPKMALNPEDKLLNSLARKHPSILKLVKTLGLINPKTNKPFHNVTTL